MPEEKNIGSSAFVVKAMFLALGIVLMLASLDFIPIDPSRLHTSPWVLFASGFVFLAIGMLAFVQPYRDRRPGAYLLAVALMWSGFTAVGALVAFYSHDEKLMIGPFVFSGPAVDAFGKVALGFCALLLGAITVWCWGRWWRASKRGRTEPT